MEGYIYLHKKILEWEWYKDVNTKSLFIHCLLKANYVDKDWKGLTIKRGQFFTSLENLSFELGLSVKEIRTSLKKLEKTQELGKQGASNGTMITVCKYEDYQLLVNMEGQAGGQTKGKRGASEGQQLINNNKKELIINNKAILDFGILKSEIWNKWIDFKKTQFKFTYKSEKSEQIGINNLIKLSGNNNSVAEEIVNQSISNGWQGLFPIKRDIIMNKPLEEAKTYALKRY